MTFTTDIEDITSREDLKVRLQERIETSFDKAIHWYNWLNETFTHEAVRHVCILHEGDLERHRKNHLGLLRLARSIDDLLDLNRLVTDMLITLNKILRNAYYELRRHR